jgi:hypothetical protein
MPEPIKKIYGYDPHAHDVAPQTEIAVLGSIDRSVRTIKNILVWWTVASCLAALLWIIERL